MRPPWNTEFKRCFLLVLYFWCFLFVLSIAVVSSFVPSYMVVFLFCYFPFTFGSWISPLGVKLNLPAWRRLFVWKLKQNRKGSLITGINSGSITKTVTITTTTKVTTTTTSESCSQGHAGIPTPGYWRSSPTSGSSSAARSTPSSSPPPPCPWVVYL